MNDSDSVLREMDIERLRLDALSAEPFPFVLIDNFLLDDVARAIVACWPTYEDAVRVGREFRSVNEKHKVQITDSAVFPEPIRLLNDALASPEFIDGVSSIFGIADLLPDAELVGGGMHQTGPRGRLDVHVDFNYIEKRRLHRRLNILVYFNPGWEPQWGGQVELWNPDVSRCVQSIDPIFNRAVIFETSPISYHGVSEVTCPRDAVRRSFAGYYYTESPPPHWIGQSHSTIFKARPTESLKSYLMTTADAFGASKQKLKSFVQRFASQRRS